jgi:hypothetical protein
MTPNSRENYNTFAGIGGDPAENNKKIVDDENDQDPCFLCDVRSTENGNLKYLINKVLFVRKDGSYTMINNEFNRIKKLQKTLKIWEKVVKTKAEFLPVRVYEIGLNYKPGETWKQHDISDYLKNMQNYTGRENVVGYSWVAEMQKRMEVHYHLEIITVEACRKIPFPDKKGHWKNGGSERDEVSCINIGYLTTDYMQKKEQKSNYPKGIRVYSAWLNDRYFDAVDFWALRSVSYPDWLVNNINNSGLINPVIKRAKGGGFVVKAGSQEYFWKNNDGYVLTGRKAIDFLDMEKYKYPIPF